MIYLHDKDSRQQAALQASKWYCMLAVQMIRPYDAICLSFLLFFLLESLTVRCLPLTMNAVLTT